MLIFDHEPADWAELQDRVAQLFSELGCDVKVCEQVKLVRGEKEIDVAVRDHAGAHVAQTTMSSLGCRRPPRQGMRLPTSRYALAECNAKFDTGLAMTESEWLKGVPLNVIRHP